MSYATNFGVVPEPIYASLGARAAAAAVDCALVWYAVKAALLCTQAGLPDPQTRALVADLARPAALLVYLIAFEGGVGATIGKMMMQLRVRGADGHPIGFGRAAGRNLAKATSVATLGLGLLPCLFLARRQALHDLLAACVVVRA